MPTKVETAFHEMKRNPPRTLSRTAKKYGAARAEKQRVAIGLNKAREAEARIPKRQGRRTQARTSSRRA
jgi:hypothetical protein